MAIVTITGGAGNLGREVALLLAARGHDVCVFDLPGADYRASDSKPNIRVVQGDLRDRQALARACREAEWVIHLAAIMPPLIEANQSLAWGVNVEGTRTLLETVPPGASLIFASSVATYGVPRSEIVAVDHPQAPVDFYGQTKLEGERHILASSHPWVILRISGVSVPALLEIPRPWFFARHQGVEFVHLRDAALAVANCVGNEGALGRIWQIAGGASWRMTGCVYSEAICRAFDTPPDTATFQDTPGWAAWYDTSASQAVLGYQENSFADFVRELRAIYEKAIGQG